MWDEGHQQEKKKSGEQANQEKRLEEIEENGGWGGNYGRAAHASSKLWVQRCVEFDCNAVKKWKESEEWVNKSGKYWHPVLWQQH